MIAEILIAVCLGLAGFGVLIALGPRLPGAARALMAFPVGAAIYMAISSLWVVMTKTVDPGVVLAVTAVVGLVGVVDTVIRGRRGFWREALVLIGAIAAVASLMRVVHLTQLTPDSLRYLLFSIHVSGPEGIAAVHDADLLNRQLGYPSLQALSVLTDRQYLASIGPLFGVSTLGLVGWTLWRALNGDRRRILLVAVAGAFLLSTNRFPYAWFYINTHIAMAAFLLIAVVGVWMAVREDEDQWAWPVGFALGAVVLLRPDSPLFAAVVLAVIAATPRGWRFRVPAVLPITVTTALWYGFTLFPHPHYQSYMSLTSPVAGNVVAVGGGVLLVLLSWTPWLRRVARHADTLMLAVMFVGFAFLAWRRLEVLAESVKATIMNVEFGGWLFTWPALAVLTIVAIFRHRIPHGRVWTVPVMAFGLLYWMLPLLRNGIYRAGTGDSGNRVLIHFVAIVVMFIALACATAIESHPSALDSSTRLRPLLRSWFAISLAFILMSSAAVNVGLTTKASHVGQPILTHPDGSLRAIVHTDQRYIRRDYGFFFQLRDVALGGRFVVHTDNPVSSDKLRVFGGISVERADFDVTALPPDLVPTTEPDGEFRPRGPELVPFWILPGEFGETRWLAELPQGWVVVPESLAPVPGRAA